MRGLGLIGLLLALLIGGLVYKRQLAALPGAVPTPGPGSPASAEDAVRSQVEAAQEESARKLRAGLEAVEPAKP
jgi:hypothetical protein